MTPTLTVRGDHHRAAAAATHGLSGRLEAPATEQLDSGRCADLRARSEGVAVSRGELLRLGRCEEGVLAQRGRAVALGGARVGYRLRARHSEVEAIDEHL